MAIRITRVYTRGGDKGKTSLVGGARVDKDCLKLESYGTVDELICLVGAARTVIADERLTPSASRATSSSKTPGLPAAVRAELETSLRRIQNRLFDMGSILATPAGQPYPGMPEITDADSTALEKDMDSMQQALEPLNSSCCRAAPTPTRPCTNAARYAAAPNGTSSACRGKSPWTTA